MPCSRGGYGNDKLIPWGKHYRKSMDIYPYLAILTLVPEDLERECNTLTLDSDLIDSNGDPAHKFTY